MIKNEHQYGLTKNLVQELGKALTELSADKEYAALSKLAQKAHVNSLKRQLAQYQSEIEEYEALKTGK